MRRLVSAFIFVLCAGLSLPSAWGQQPQPAGLQSVAISGTLLFVGGAPAVDTGGKIVMLVMPRFYYLSYSQLFQVGTPVVVRGSEFSPQAAASSRKDTFVVVDELSIAGMEFTIFRSATASGTALGTSGGRAAAPTPAAPAATAGPPAAGGAPLPPRRGIEGSGSGDTGPGQPGGGLDGGRQSGFGPPPR